VATVPGKLVLQLAVVASQTPEGVGPPAPAALPLISQKRLCAPASAQSKAVASAAKARHSGRLIELRVVRLGWETMPASSRVEVRRIGFGCLIGDWKTEIGSENGLIGFGCLSGKGRP
jgi:hypothetical protein